VVTDGTRIAELDRISSKLERLSAQRKALREAMRQFGDEFDAKTWSNAFMSSETEDINRVLAVTGGYLALVNNTSEAVKAGAMLVGLKPPAGRLGTAGYVEAIRVNGGFSNRQAETFIELYRTRNRLQHSSPDIEADEVHRQVRLLLRHLPRLVKSFLDWLARHGVQL
jgi:hypothetical protein